MAVYCPVTVNFEKNLCDVWCVMCDVDYVGFTARHVHQRITEHNYSSIGKHLLEVHGDKNLFNEGQFLEILYS